MTFDVENSEWAGPTSAMRDALGLVQHDLDVAGLDRYQMSFAAAGSGWDGPIVNVQFRGTWTSDGIDVNAAAGAHMIAQVAEATSQCLVELEEIYWPFCPAHQRRARATVLDGEQAAWVCREGDQRSHVLAPIGHLEQALKASSASRPLWHTLHRR